MKNGKHIKQLRIPKGGMTSTLSRVIMVFAFMAFCLSANAQDSKIKVSGKITDTNGEVLIGASIAEKGTTNATITGIAGDYTLSVSPQSTLVVTYIGYLSKEVAVAGKTKHDFSLSEDDKVLEEVVVTALGIKRDKKALGYSLQEVKGDKLTETRDANVANALAGKVAGLQIKQSGTGPAGSSRIVLRGNNSIGGNNQPLVVVDGVPIDSSTGGSDDFWGNRATDRGAGMADISPDDIETISVLKGPAAAALYGSRAGNGVIMITTKTGKKGTGIGISFNTNLTFDSPMELPKFQNSYGQGANGELNRTSKTSWGAKMTGQKYTNHVGKDLVYSSDDNDIKDFLRTGSTWTNSLEFTKGGETSTVRVGVMNMNNKSIVPNSDFKRTSFTLRGTAELTPKLSFDSKITYINQETNNRVKLGGDPDNIFRNFLIMPRSVHMRDFNWGENGYRSAYGNILNPYAYPKGTISLDTENDLSGKPIEFADPDGGSIRNPYWAAYNNTNNDRKNRFIGFASLKYEFADWLNIQGRYGMDYSSSQYKDILASGTPYWTDQQGLTMSKDESYEVNADFLITFNKNLTEKLGLIATAGGNTMYARSEGMWAQTRGIYIEYLYTLANGLDKDIINSLTRRQINSLYATTSLAWDNTFFLDLTARNDWASTLNPDNRSYFYPSVGGSWLFTESLNKANIKPSFLNYGKVRLSWAQVGNAADPYQLYNTRSIKVDNKTGALAANKSDVMSLYDLKNETINSWEVGLEMKALNNRVSLDLAYYNKDAKDQILKMNIPSATGYSYKYVNAGNVRNRGIEVLLSGTPLQSKDFTWDIAVNSAKNNNKIVELADGIEQQILSDGSYAGMIQIVARAGGSYGDIYGKPYARNDKGEIIVSADGLPTFDSDRVKLGNGNPKWMGGLNNTFRYKDFNLAFQIDMRYGGDVYMGSINAGAAAGTLDFTENGRESMLVEGVLADGTKNTVTTTAEKYWTRLAGGSGGAEPFIYDATNVRLREVSIGYSVPKKLLAKGVIKDAKFSLVGRNLWMIHSKTKGFDPEAGFTTGNAQGFEFGSMPTLRSFGFNLNVTF